MVYLFTWDLWAVVDRTVSRSLLELHHLSRAVLGNTPVRLGLFQPSMPSLTYGPSRIRTQQAYCRVHPVDWAAWKEPWLFGKTSRVWKLFWVSIHAPAAR